MYGCLCGQIEKVLVKNMVVSEASTFLQWINQLLLLTLWGSSGFLIYNLVFCQKMNTVCASVLPTHTATQNFYLLKKL